MGGKSRSLQARSCDKLTVPVCFQDSVQDTASGLATPEVSSRKNAADEALDPEQDNLQRIGVK